MTRFNWREWTLDIEPFYEATMYSANATISRGPNDADDEGDSYTFKYLGLSDSEHGAFEWAAAWLKGWISDNF